MLQSRTLLAATGGAAGSGASGSAWESLKKKFKGKFMIGDTHEPYMPPSPAFVARPSRYDATKDADSFRSPAPGSQPVPVIPRGYPETEFDISISKRPNMKITPSGGVTDPTMIDLEKTVPDTLAFGRSIPRHVPQPSWTFDRASLKRIRRFYLETGLVLPGAPSYGMRNTYRPVLVHNMREEWEATPVIRDIRKPRI